MSSTRYFEHFARFFQRGRASVVVGGQFGSEAKGLAAAMVAQGRPGDSWPLICTTNAGAQAGHTTILRDGRKFVCFHLPTIGVLHPGAVIVLNAGSIIDPHALQMEVAAVASVTGEPEGALRKRIIIHPQAAVIRSADVARERHEDSHAQRIGSTRKGVGEALVAKIRRDPDAVAGRMGRDVASDLSGFAICEADIPAKLAKGWTATVEIPQGTGLSLNAGGFYPYCTSRDCWVGQGLTDAGLHPYYLGQVLMVQRTFPIRVGHIYDNTGRKIGDSGSFYPDSDELDWAAHFPGIAPEITTVTRRVRRIATWSPTQYTESLTLNRPTHVLTTFCNYIPSGVEFAVLRHRMEVIERSTGMYPPDKLWSYGPGLDQWSSDPEKIGDALVTMRGAA